MTTAAPVRRYTRGRAHKCGCITVWDNKADSVRFTRACSTHRNYARKYMAAG